MACADYITTDTSKRLIRDIKDIYKEPLKNEGIYYIHDDSNMLKGYAMIIGPNDTPYECGIYLFEFNFPSDYPYSPPRLVFRTVDLDYNTRFNPNLYRSGKVCLSILNTWSGEAWSSCQSIRSILLTLVTVLNENPLLNEPGVHENSKSIEPYNKIISYRNLKCAVVDMGTKRGLPNSFHIFYDDIKKHLLKNKDKIISNIKKFPFITKQEVSISIYTNMNVVINGDLLLHEALNMFKCLNV
jgi:ubiquitin-conjugating enzyme E2 Z